MLRAPIASAHASVPFPGNHTHPHPHPSNNPHTHTRHTGLAVEAGAAGGAHAMGTGAVVAPVDCAVANGIDAIAIPQTQCGGAAAVWEDGGGVAWERVQPG